jgi:hypothetical protein
VVAGLGAVLGSWAGWQTAPALVSTESATEIAEVAFPGRATGEPARTDALYSFASVDDPVVTAIFGGDGYAAGTVDVPLSFGPASAQAGSEVALATEALTASGWSVREFRARGGYESFTAARDGVALRVQALDRSTFMLQVGRAGQIWTPVLAAVGAVLGAMAGWFWSRWLMSRTTGRGAARGAVIVLTLVGMALVTPALLLGALAVVYAAVTDSDPWAPAWIGFTAVGLRAMAWLAAVLALATAAVGVATARVGR